MSSSKPPPASITTTPAPAFPTRPYNTPHPNFPYTASDLTPQDTTPDPSFYSSPRYVTHIDDHAIALLKDYYAGALPERGRVLDLCSSWVSHFPPALEDRAVATAKRIKTNDDGGATIRGASEEGEGDGLEVVGLGMSKPELDANPVLAERVVQDLNTNPTIDITPVGGNKQLDATVCVVSIDYLTNPLTVLSSIREQTKPGGSVHLVVSNRCFPTKCVGRWLRVSETERLEMVGDYLAFSGWEGVEIVEVCDGRVKEGEDLGEMGGGGRWGG
ncbi:MAG: hypothetical protein OHK93_003886 [Ramalina farinacea]|uniref:Uncharacterized protein n=1 Tax=Ramalina farinacea TaxID=258253 RepID=A0AA43QFP2_9LECA|nr:hypothetical protein [Ramalina farinacea]